MGKSRFGVLRQSLDRRGASEGDVPQARRKVSQTFFLIRSQAQQRHTQPARTGWPNFPHAD
ncbi:MAG: hypothetical protein ACJAVR_003548 [Paracoccaceae bacterium]|jgi:hypothetical protein